MALKQVRDIVASVLDEQKMADWFGRYMTAPKYDSDDAQSPIEDDFLDAVPELYVESASRLAYRETDASCFLYADGEHYQGDSEHWHAFVRELCAQHYLDFSHQPGWLHDPEVRSTLTQLLQRGVLSHE